MPDTDAPPARALSAPPGAARRGVSYPAPDRNLIPLHPRDVPGTLELRGYGTCTVQRVSLNDLASGAHEARHGVRFERVVFLGRLGNAALYVPANRPAQTEEDDDGQ